MLISLAVMATTLMMADAQVKHINVFFFDEKYIDIFSIYL